MKRTKYLVLVPALAVLATTQLTAQDGGDAAGGNVRDRGQQQTDEFRLPEFVNAPLGARALITNQDEQRLGVVRDHLIESRSGKVRFMAVGSAEHMDEKAHLVPYDSFIWNAELKRLVLPMTAEQLAALPEYDPKNLPPVNARVAIDKASGGAEKEGEQVGKDGLGTGTKEAAAKLDQLYLASSGLLRCEIMAVTEPFAGLREFILEPKSGKIAFVLAGNDATKADPYIIPWTAMKWHVSDDVKSVGHFALTLSKDALEEAPKLTGGEIANLKKAETIASIYGFYKLTPPMPKPMTKPAK